MKNRVKHIWNNFERYGMIIFFIVFFLNVFMQIVSRVVFNQPFKFTEEVSRYCFVWMVFLGMAYGTRYDAHIRVDIVVKLLPKTAQFIINILIDIITLVVFTWIVYSGVKYVAYTSITDIYTLPINKGIVVAIVPLTGILVILRCIGKLVRDCRNYKSVYGGIK